MQIELSNYLNTLEITIPDQTAFVYIWIHNELGFWYLGSRIGIGSHPEDGYICSSTTTKDHILKHPEQWSRRILYIGDRDTAFRLETQFLRELKAAQHSMSLNCHNNWFYQNPSKLNNHPLKPIRIKRIRPHQVFVKMEINRERRFLKRLLDERSTPRYLRKNEEHLNFWNKYI